MPSANVKFNGSTLLGQTVETLGQTQDYVDQKIINTVRFYYAATAPGEVTAKAPNELPGLAYWLRGDFATGVMGGPTEINDGAGSGFYLTQSDPNKRPLLVQTDFHSQPGFRFNASAQQYLQNSAFNLTSGRQQGTWIIAFKGNTTGTQALVSPYNHVLGVHNDNGDVYVSHHGGAQEFGHFQHPSRDSGQLVIATFDGTAADNAHRLKLRINKVDRPLIFNGAPIAGTAYATSPSVKVGTHWAATMYLNTDALEWAFYPRVLTFDETEQVEEYFRQRYFSLGRGNVHYVGDSLTKGYPQHTVDGQDPVTLLAGLLGSNWACQNHGQTAYSIQLMEGAAESVTTPDRNEWRDTVNGGLGDWVVHQGGTNNLFPHAAPPYGNQEADTAIAEMVTSVTKRHNRGFKVAVWTIPPVGTSSGSGMTPSQQGVYESRRVAFNNAVRAGATGADTIIDIAADPRLSDPSNATYFYQVDTVHFTAAGNAVIAELSKAAILALP